MSFSLEKAIPASSIAFADVTFGSEVNYVRLQQAAFLLLFSNFWGEAYLNMRSYSSVISPNEDVSIWLGRGHCVSRLQCLLMLSSLVIFFVVIFLLFIRFLLCIYDFIHLWQICFLQKYKLHMNFEFEYVSTIF
jgi:hypothetical protein